MPRAVAITLILAFLGSFPMMQWPNPLTYICVVGVIFAVHVCVAKYWRSD